MRPIQSACALLIYCAFLPCAAHAADDAKPPSGRADSLLNAFEVMCNLETPDFEKLSAKAAAMRMQVLEDISELPQAGQSIQRKAWVGMLTTGPFALGTEKMSGAKGVATSCSIEGPVPDVDAFRQLVINTMHLSDPTEVKVVEGSHVSYWDNRPGKGMTIMVRDMERPGGHFVQVKLLDMVGSHTP
jgi:hypothetical protein